MISIRFRPLRALAMFTVSLFALPLVAAADDVVCLTNSFDYADVLTVDCVSPIPAAHVSATTGFSTAGVPCSSDLCGPGEKLYGWSLSSSATDPNENVGAVPGGLFSLYLWLNCDENGGWSAATMSIVPTNVDYLALITLNGVLNARDQWDPLFAVGQCPAGPMLVAELLFFNGPVAVENSTWSRIKSQYR